jgi:hypothetical protein
MGDISVRKLGRAASRWLGKVGAVLSTKSRDGGVVYTSDRGGFMGRMARIEEGEYVGLLGSREGLHGHWEGMLWFIWCMFNLFNKVT